MIRVEMNNDSRRLLTPRAVAERLGVSYSTFKQWIYKGSVRTVQTSGGHHQAGGLNDVLRGAAVRKNISTFNL